MGMTYNKKFISKDRQVTSAGPRDRQLKQQGQVDNLLVDELRNQVASLQDRLANSDVGYTAAQFNEMLADVVKKETAALAEKHENEKSDLIKKISFLEENILELKGLIKSKDEIIAQLKSTPQQVDNKLTDLLAEATKKIENMANKISTYENTEAGVPSDRPQMETIFVDPIEKESSVEKHVEIEEDKESYKKEVHVDKVAKLKNLLGGLPKKG